MGKSWTKILCLDLMLCLLLFCAYGARKAEHEAEVLCNADVKAEYKKIALTFDDGPHPYYTEELLDGLKERGVHATFFVTGEHAKLHPDVLKRMQEEGHLIGNHTYSHIQLTSKNREKFKQELIDTNAVIQEITGEEVDYVRPPYGSWDKSFEKELNIPVICLSQLSRANEKRDDKRPMLSDLRESGAIEQDADIVLFLYRDDYYNEDSEKHNIAECIVAKNRHGETGKVELRWMPEYTTFATLDNRYGDDE